MASGKTPRSTTINTAVVIFRTTTASFAVDDFVDLACQSEDWQVFNFLRGKGITDRRWS